MSKGIRILVVERDFAVSKWLLMLLGARGYNVDLVGTGQQALSRANGADLILLDLVLPDDDGLRICYLLKISAQTRNIPIIILSGRNQDGDRLQSFSLGADDFIGKPLQAEELFTRVEASLSRRKIIFDGGQPKTSSYETIYELHQIVDQKKITPFFQPIYTLNPMKLFGMEVLSRTQPGSMFSTPETLFKTALDFGMYYELEMMVWRKAIEIVKTEFKTEHLFLNCSPYLIESNRAPEVKEMFKDFDFEHRHVFLELTERSAICEYETFFKYLANYRWNGFRIAIDDVGAGYASLESIVQTKPEVVKIDRQIVTGLGEDPFKRSIVKLIVAFCRENAIICIAEGIETQRDLEILVEMGVQAGQGYYLYRPTEHIDLDAMRTVGV